MEWTQLITVIAANAGLFLWARSESRADFRTSEKENKELRRELIEVMREAKEEHKKFSELWAQESKEFHGRLCAIEERRLRDK